MRVVEALACPPTASELLGVETDPRDWVTERRVRSSQRRGFPTVMALCCASQLGARHLY